MPVLVSVNVTVNGAGPFVGVAVKLATGATTPAPINRFEELPPSLLNCTELVKLPNATGANCTVTFVPP